MPRLANTKINFLSGWKEIANYVGRGVRTVQRYERDLGFPVRRPASAKRGASVIATRAEIDGWIAASPVRQQFRLSVPALNSAEIVRGVRQQVSELRRLCGEAAQCRDELKASREMLRTAIRQLHDNLGFAFGENGPRLSSKRQMADLLTFDSKRKPN